MRRIGRLAAPLVALLFTVQAHGQSVTYNFEDGTDQGFGTGFGNDASASFPIVNIGGSHRMGVLDTASFQQAGRETTGPADPLFLALTAASADAAGYLLTYDWYIDTSPSPGNNGNFLQLGTYVNSSSGYYAQNFPGAGKEVELTGAQLASGQVFSGTVSQTFSDRGFNLPTGETFFRFGFIINGDGTNVTVYYDNVTIRPVVPEPTAVALLAAAIPTMLVLRRRCVRR